MRKTLLYTTAIFLFAICRGQNTQPSAPIIPKPATIHLSQGYFVLNEKTAVITGASGNEQDLAFSSPLP